MDNQSCESSKTVTLVLRDCRVKANKSKLASSSLYFASLFSDNFKDHRQKEFAINYEIPLETLQDFVYWVDNEGEHSNSIDSERYHFTVKKALQKFLAENHSELLELLKLSILFMAEKLTEDITEMIICMRLSPDDMLKTWLLAGNLGLKVLENVTLAVCLDRFEELAMPSLLNLSLVNFSKLLCNVNIRSSPERLMNIREAWIKLNGLTTDMSDWSSRFVNTKTEDVITPIMNAKPYYVQCVTGQKLNKSQFIYYWNGETLQELVEIGREIIGDRFVARGFSIYVVGHKKGENNEKFSTTIWRYCVFTKKCYIETVLPRRQQGMEVVFVENKLYLFGGIDPTGQPIPALDVYDVHTGVWSTAADIPESETIEVVRSSCAADGKIVFRRGRSLNVVYDPLIDEWKGLRYPPQSCGFPIDEKYVLIGSHKNLNIEDPVLYFRRTLAGRKLTILCYAVMDFKEFFYINEIHEWDTTIMDQQVTNGPLLVSFAYSNGRANVEVGEMIHPKGKRAIATYQNVKTHSQELHDVPANCFQLDTGCFNLIEPKTLHTTISLPVKLV